MLFEARAREFQELRGRLQIDLGANDVLMPEIGRKPGELGVDVSTFLRPCCQAVNRERMPKLIWARSDAPLRGLNIEAAQELANSVGRRVGMKWRAVEANEQRFAIPLTTIVKHPASIIDIEGKL